MGSCSGCSNDEERTTRIIISLPQRRQQLQLMRPQPMQPQFRQLNNSIDGNLNGLSASNVEESKTWKPDNSTSLQSTERVLLNTQRLGQQETERAQHFPNKTKHVLFNKTIAIKPEQRIFSNWLGDPSQQIQERSEADQQSLTHSSQYTGTRDQQS